MSTINYYTAWRTIILFERLSLIVYDYNAGMYTWFPWFYSFNYSTNTESV